MVSAVGILFTEHAMISPAVLRDLAKAAGHGLRRKIPHANIVMRVKPATPTIKPFGMSVKINTRSRKENRYTKATPKVMVLSEWIRGESCPEFDRECRVDLAKNERISKHLARYDEKVLITKS